MAIRSAGTDTVKREVSPLIPQTVLRYVAASLGEAAAYEVVERARVGLTLDEVLEDGRWFDFHQAIALATAAGEVCGDGDIGRRAGERLFISACERGFADFFAAKGSIGAAMSDIVASGTKMSTGATFRIVDTGENEVVVEGTYQTATPDHAFFCGFTAGFYSQVPSLFGAVGRVAEPQCQTRGDRSCRYHLTWSQDPRPRQDADHSASAQRAEHALERFEQLQTMATELVQADDVAEVLDRITERAGVAVHAPRYLLAARTNDLEPLRVHHFGFRDDAHAHRWAARLLAGELGESDGILVTPVRSPRRDYGLFAAVYTPGAEFGPRDRRLIDAYAGHAAAALEVVASLALARRDRDSAHSILGLARELAVLGTSDDIAGRLASAISDVTGCDRAGVWLWQDASDELVLAANHDIGGHAVPAPGSVRIPTDDIPNFADIVAQPRAALLQVDEVAPTLKSLLELGQLVSAAVVPITSRGELLGFASAGFRHKVSDGPLATDLLDRLDGVAHYAATAFENAELLDNARYGALHDGLTGLPNRTLVQDRAELALAHARRTGARVGLLFVDLDRFKNVNDSLGHGSGDSLIREVGRRLASVVREGDTLGRLGGDEFVVLLSSIADSSDAAAVAGRLITALSGPFTLDEQELFISCSIGIACSPEHGVDYETLMGNADAAMYEAKALGRSTYAVHSAALHRDRRQRLALESDLHKAVENDELRLYFQAQIDLQTMRPVGVEALVRWQHPELGLLAPAAFLPMAEESGLIVEIDRWVRRTAFAQGRAWVDAGTPVRVAVNLSARELGNPRLADRLAIELCESGLRPDLAEIEITDRVAMEAEQLRDVLTRLRSLGVRLAIDDFGTGNSVLGRLQRCPVDTLKIDRSFVQEIGPDAVESPVVQALVALARSLDLTVIAEGVETEQQAEVLRRYGCGVAQGFLYSRPAPPDELDLSVQTASQVRGWAG